MSCFELNSYCFTKKKKKKKKLCINFWMYGCVNTELRRNPIPQKTRLGITFPNSETRCQYP